MLQQLGMPEEAAAASCWHDVQWGALKRGHATADPKPVFARIEGDFVIDPAPAAAAAAAGGKR
jgi:methionyl-tRNA synthetase